MNCSGHFQNKRKTAWKVLNTRAKRKEATPTLKLNNCALCIFGLAAYVDHGAEVTVLRWKGGGERNSPVGLKWVFPEVETTSDYSLHPALHELESFVCVST